MKHRNEAVTALVCCVIIAAFVIGMRLGLHDSDTLVTNAEKAVETQYQANIESLQIALEQEKQVEHVVYEYVPLPVEYESLGTEQPDETDAVIIAKTLYGEYRDSSNYDQCAAVVWCILNRVDAGYGDIKSVCTGGQFHGYNAANPVDAALYNIVIDVMTRWELEKLGVNTDVGRTLPSGFLWFDGNGRTNTYRNAYSGGEKVTP